MRATVMYSAGDVRIEDVPDPSIVDPTDAILRVTRACICGSDLWPYASMAVNATGVEVTPSGAAAFIEDATEYPIFGRR